MSAPAYIYRIAEISSFGHYFTLHRMAMTPQTAARHNQQAFLALADAIAKEARRIREEQSQLEMLLGDPNA